MRKQFLKDILVETIAIILGVASVLILDDWRDTKKKKEDIHNYFGLVKSQMVRDSLYTYELSNDFQMQLRKIDTMLSTNLLTIDKLDNLQKNNVYQPPIELLENLLTTDSYTTIYDSATFDAINDQIKDFKTFNYFQCRIEAAQQDFYERYLNDARNPFEGSITVSQKMKENCFINDILALKELYDARCTTILSIQLNYQTLLQRINFKLQ